MPKQERFDIFAPPSSWISRMAKLNQDVLFGTKEATLLTVFYDERLKNLRDVVPKFVMYARVCEATEPDQWNAAMIEVDRALLNLKEIDFLAETRPRSFAQEFIVPLGQSGTLYTLTKRGTLQLQKQKPPATLRLRAWIAVLPPWLVTTGTVAGGITALWKFTELLLKLLWPENPLGGSN